MRAVLIFPEHVDPSLQAQPTLVVSPNLDSCEDLPAAVTPDGIIISRWELTDEERKSLIVGGHVYLFVWAGDAKFQPVSLTVGP